MIFDVTNDKYELRRMLHESSRRIDELLRREQKLVDKRLGDEATEIAHLRIDEQKRFNQILGQLTGAL